MKKYILKMEKIVQSKIFILSVCTGFVLVAALYYYGLQCEYPPDAENIVTISLMFSHLILGTDYPISEIMYRVCAYLSTKLGGMSYFAVRFHFTLLYAILMALTLILCLKPKGLRRVKMYQLPFIALLSVILFPVADDPQLFQNSVGGDLIYTYPFHYHYPARIYTLICLLLFVFVLYSPKQKIKALYGILLGAVCIYALGYTDLIFYIMFLTPLAIVIFIHGLHSERFKKICYICIYGGVGLLMLSRILPSDLRRILWMKEKAGVYGVIYGGTNWSPIQSLGEKLLSYAETVFTLFNIQITDAPVISLYTILYLLKITILVVGYMLVFHIIKCSICGSCLEFQYDCADELLAWSYLLLSAVYIFTGFGEQGFAKYFVGLTTIMTIIVCRNTDVLYRAVRKHYGSIKYRRLKIFALTSVLCACSMGKVWTYQAPDKYNNELEQMIEYIENTEYGHVLAPYWLYPRVSALSHGKTMAYRREDDIKNIYGADAKISYIITRNYENPNNTWDNSMLTWYDNCESDEQIREYFSEPTNIIHYEYLQLVVFKEGMERIKENDIKYPFP